MSEDRLEKAWQLHQQGALDQAANIYAQVLEAEPTHQRGLFLLGALETQRGRVEEGYQRLSAAANLAPDDLDILNAIGIAARRTGRIDEAVRHLSRAAELEPRDAIIRLNHGAALREQGDLEGAIAAYRAALEINPRMPEAHNNLANALAANGESNEAISHYRQAIDLHPEFVDAHRNLGTAARRTGDMKTAVEHLERAAALNPTPTAQTELADIQLATDLLREAEQNFALAVEADPSLADAHFGRALAQLRQERPEPAIENLRQTTELDRDHFGAWFNLGAILWNENRHLEAIPALQEALRLDPKNEIVRHLMSSVRGETPDTAPDSYIAELFNEYAGRFEKHLVEQLQYEVPWIMRRMYDAVAGKNAEPLSRGLDLGCGTGLIGRAFEGALVAIDGIDIAEKMVEKTLATGRYAHVRAGELVATLRDLEGENRRYDLITAGDVFVYVGRLDDTFERVASILEPGGRFFFSVEGSDDLDVVLRRSGRYAQSDTYVRRLASEHGFTVVAAEPIAVRTEIDRPIPGFVYLLRRP